jgi:hypothetical protein
MLLAYAQLTHYPTLTGFIGLVFVFGERSRRVSNDRSSALYHLIHASLNALFLSPFAALLLVYLAAEEQALIFMLATLWLLGVTVIAFVSLLLSGSRPVVDSGG